MMLALPHLSGRECIEALARFGYRARPRSGGLAALHRGPTVVLVPEAATLSPALVGHIVRAADIDPLEFVRALEEGARGPAPRVA